MEKGNSDRALGADSKKAKVWLWAAVAGIIVIIVFPYFISEETPRVVSTLDGDEWRPLGETDRIPRELVVAPDGDLWGRDRAGVYRLQSGRFEPEGPDWGQRDKLHAFVSERWSRLLIGAGELWYLNSTGGFRRDGERWRRVLDIPFSRKPVASGGDARGIWLITRDGRYFESQQDGWSESPLSGIEVRASSLSRIRRTDDGAIWMLSPEDRLLRFDGARWETTRDDLVFPGGRLFTAVGGDLWLVQGERLLRLDTEAADGVTVFPPASLHLSDAGRVHSVIARGPALWLDTSEGLRFFRDGSWRWPVAPHGTIEVLALGADGTPWVETALVTPLRAWIQHWRREVLIFVLALGGLFTVFAFKKYMNLLMGGLGTGSDAAPAAEPPSSAAPSGDPASRLGRLIHAIIHLTLRIAILLVPIFVFFWVYREYIDPELLRHWPDAPDLSGPVLVVGFVVVVAASRWFRRQSDSRGDLTDWWKGAGKKYISAGLSGLGLVLLFNLDDLWNALLPWPIPFGSVFITLILLVLGVVLAFFALSLIIVMAWGLPIEHALLSGNYRRALRLFSGVDTAAPDKSRPWVVSFFRGWMFSHMLATKTNQIQFAMGAFSEAESNLREALANLDTLCPDSDDLSKEATERIDRRLLEDRRQSYAKASALLARALFEQGRYEEADAALAAAARRNPAEYRVDLISAELLLRRGGPAQRALHLLDEGEGKLARAGFLRRFDDRNDWVPRLASLRAWALAAGGDRAAAEAACQSVEEQVSKRHRAPRAAICFDLGQAYRALGEHEHSERCLRSAVENDPEGHSGALARRALNGSAVAGGGGSE